jgi:hypothetical protein
MCVCVCVCVCLIICDLEIEIMKLPRPYSGCCTTKKSVLSLVLRGKVDRVEIVSDRHHITCTGHETRCEEINRMKRLLMHRYHLA